MDENSDLRPIFSVVLAGRPSHGRRLRFEVESSGSAFLNGRRLCFGPVGAGSAILKDDDSDLGPPPRAEVRLLYSVLPASSNEERKLESACFSSSVQACSLPPFQIYGDVPMLQRLGSGGALMVQGFG
ncbi:unnamed protein product [Cuscuta epithymum]|uniref:FHA domain-containing protein n=1 Tax=Cuscuta epithymum TaxID=186058 RepID=A0AAV0F0N5_9ASTE|nr:unnamed protein product [Cuscuta epithymum]